MKAGWTNRTNIVTAHEKWNGGMKYQWMKGMTKVLTDGEVVKNGLETVGDGLDGQHVVAAWWLIRL